MNFGAKFRHAFAVDGEIAEPTPEQSAAVDAFARWVARRGMTSLILLMLESSKPLNWTVAQGLHFADPVLGGAASHDRRTSSTSRDVPRASRKH